MSNSGELRTAPSQRSRMTGPLNFPFSTSGSGRFTGHQEMVQLLYRGSLVTPAMIRCNPFCIGEVPCPCNNTVVEHLCNPWVNHRPKILELSPYRGRSKTGGAMRAHPRTCGFPAANSFTFPSCDHPFVFSSLHTGVLIGNVSLTQSGMNNSKSTWASSPSGI